MPSKADIKATYVHYFKPAEPTSYPEGFSHILITKPEKVDKLLRLIESIDEVSVDLEATSLNTEIADIVGIGLCFEETRSFYLPIRHKVDEEQNLPESTIKLIYDEVIKKKKTLWYNFTYDGALWEKEGHDIELVDFYDVMGLVWLADTNIKKIPLDWAAGHFLGWQNIMKFKEMIGSLENFSYLSPEDAKFYACTDPLAIFNLYKLLYPAMSKECPFTLNLDNKVVLPLIRGQAEDHLIGKKELLEVSDEIDAHLPELEKEIYKETGKVFDINSPAQVADALESLGLDTGARTKGGKLVTRADLLDKLDHPVAQKIVEFKHLANMKGSFINPFMPYADGAKKCRFKYFLWAVPTGRFSSGKDEKNPYFAGVNIQAIVKPRMVKKYAHYVGDGQGILGWIFNDVESDREVEVPEERRNVRRAFKAPEGWWYVRADYAGQELRIPANLSGETVWIEAFLDKRDIHNEVCKDVFGEPTSEKRKMTKAVNFGIIYGSTPYSFSKKFNKTEEEGVEFYARYKKKHPRLFAWIESEQRKAQLRGVCYTPFGRPRRLYHYFQSVDRKVRAFAQRSTTNSIVQGGAADIFRIGFVNLYHRLYKKYPLESRFQMAVHDEMDSLIKKGSEHLIDLMVEILTLRRKDWPVPMEVGIEVGTSWGDLVGFVKEDEEWRPKRKER